MHNSPNSLYTDLKIGGCVMDDDETFLYDRMPVKLLAGFYYHINKNINNGILSNAMYHEINLIKQVAVKKGISLTHLYERGSTIK